MAAATDSLSVRRYNTSHGSHSHAHFQVLLGLDGVLDLEIEGRGTQVGAGAGVVIAPGDRHDFESRAGASCLVLDSSNSAWRGAIGVSDLPADALSLARYLAQACELGRTQGPRIGPMLLLESWPSLPTGGVQRARRAIDWPALNTWAQSRTDLPGVADLARQAHLSAAQFSARCQQELGLSPMQWLRRQRLVRARTWLTNGLSVAQTARRAGYRSTSALTAALRRERL